LAQYMFRCIPYLMACKNQFFLETLFQCTSAENKGFSQFHFEWKCLEISVSHVLQKRSVFGTLSPCFAFAAQAVISRAVSTRGDCQS
jgi:hypothetical protein